jgi:hypothetical protein
MNCAEITDRIAAYLDGQLCPAESEQVSEHLNGCTPCHQLCDCMMAQDFAPLSQEEKDAMCGAGFWGPMDTALDKELANLERSGTDGAGWSKGRVGLPMTVAVAYAAALLLAMAWGYRHMERADDAETTAKDLKIQLDQERRIAAEPRVSPEVPAYRPVSYTPRRATF